MSLFNALCTKLKKKDLSKEERKCIIDMAFKGASVPEMTTQMKRYKNTVY